MHLLFSLLRIKGLYMFRALLANPQEAIHKRHLVYCVRVVSVGCYQDWSGTGVFEHYLLILRMRYTNGTWYIACVLCQLAAIRIGLELVSETYRSVYSEIS
jgi:hypothetical protein